MPVENAENSYAEARKFSLYLIVEITEILARNLETVGSTCRYAATEVLRSFVILVMRLAQKLKTADEILKYALSDLKGNQNVVPTKWKSKFAKVQLCVKACARF